MRAGGLDRRITIEKKVVSGRTANGAPSTSWRTLAVVWAKVEFGNDGAGAGSEMDRAERTISMNNARITIRYRDDIDITGGVRVRWNGQIFNVTSVGPGYGRREQLVLMATTENV